MKKNIFVILLIIFSIILQFNLTLKAETQNSALELHKNSWSELVKQSKTNNYSKYGIYTSRILTVFHPEIYLKADMLFLETLDNKQLSSYIFETNDSKQSQFNINSINLKDYNIINSRETYPSDVPYLKYLDKRALSISTFLREVRNNNIEQTKDIKEIELAFLFYSLQRIKHKTPKDKLYIIYCKNEETYIRIDTNLYSMKTLKKVNNIKGKPILIFNEEAVWYPLMGRDDTFFNSSLKNVVNRYQKQSKKPEITKFENKIIDKLKIVTKLPVEERNIAILASTKLNPNLGFESYYLKDNKILKMWEKVLSNYPKEIIATTIKPHPAGGLGYIILGRFTKEANKLSPLSAYASSFLSDFKNKSFKKLEKWYQSNFEYNILWKMGLLHSTIDESFITQNLSCEIHSLNWEAIFALQNKQYYALNYYWPNGATHAIVYIPSLNIIADNYSLINSNEYQNNYQIPLYYISTNNSWSTTMINQLIGDMKKSQLRQIYTNVINNDKFDMVGLKFNTNSSLITTTENENILKYIDSNNISKVNL